MFTIALVIFVVVLELYWTPSGAGGRVVGHTKFWTKTSKLAEAFLKKWKGGPQNSSASTFCWKSLKTWGVLMILSVREPRAGNLELPTLENARTP